MGAVTTLERLREAMLSDLVFQINRALENAQPRILNRFREALSKRIIASPEFQSLSASGFYTLRALFGIERYVTAKAVILEQLLSECEVKLIPFSFRKSGGIEGGIVINAVRSDYADLLRREHVSYVTDEGVLIEWLRWLLLFGTRVVVRGYTARQANTYEAIHFSRSSDALMKAGGDFRIPSEWAGTARANFILRSLTGLENDLIQIIQRELRKSGL